MMTSKKRIGYLAKGMSLALTILIFVSCAESQTPLPSEENIKYVRAGFIKRADDIDLEIKPDNGLRLEILSYEARNGFWPWSDAKVEVSYRLTNMSDTTIYITPPYNSPYYGNPSFLLRKDSLSVRSASLEVRNIIPGSFIKLDPKGYVQYHTCHLYADNFEEGAVYNLTAYYGNSRWAAFTDEAGKRVPIWTGRVSSDTIKFTY